MYQFLGAPRLFWGRTQCQRMDTRSRTPRQFDSNTRVHEVPELFTIHSLNNGFSTVFLTCSVRHDVNLCFQ
jgi:hypothetical protein